MLSTPLHTNESQNVRINDTGKDFRQWLKHISTTPVRYRGGMGTRQAGSLVLALTTVNTSMPARLPTVQTTPITNSTNADPASAVAGTVSTLLYTITHPDVCGLQRGYRLQDLKRKE